MIAQTSKSLPQLEILTLTLTVTSTRLLRGDVMTYSYTKHVSYITLALFADLPWYHVHFERTECGVTWGRNQGCDFLWSRCGIHRHDRSVAVAGPSACVGPDQWRTVHHPQLDDRCDHGDAPCAHAYADGFCDAQCAPEPGSAAGGTDVANNATCSPPVNYSADAHTRQRHEDERNGLGLFHGENALLIEVIVLAGGACLLLVGVFAQFELVEAAKPGSDDGS